MRDGDEQHDKKKWGSIVLVLQESLVVHKSRDQWNG